MGTINSPEIRECTLSPKERAEARDSYVRSFDSQFADWSSIAKVCVDVERDKDFILLGFESWHQWLLSAAPRSRAYIYWAVKTYQKLSPDISDEDLSQIPPGSAKVLMNVSPAVRKVSNIRQVARQKPSKLRAAIKKDFPEQHVEMFVDKKCKFAVSQWENIEDGLEAYRALEDENMSLESLIEWTINDWLDGLSSDGRTSRRTVWERMKADANKNHERRPDNPQGLVVQ